MSQLNRLPLPINANWLLVSRTVIPFVNIPGASGQRFQGIADIQAEERMRAQLAEDALSSFEVELGLKSPETTPVAQTSKDLGPAVEKAVEKQM